MYNPDSFYAANGRQFGSSGGSARPAQHFGQEKRFSSDILTIGYTLSGSLSYVSDSYARYFGRAPEELLGKNMAWCLASRDISTVLRALSTLSTKTPSAAISHSVVRPDGSEALHYWLHMIRLSDKGDVVCYNAAGMEIDPAQALAANPEMVLQQHLQRAGNAVVGSDHSGLRCFAR